MPITRRQLTRVEMAEYFVRAQEMRAAGIDMNIPQKWGHQAAEEQKKSVILEIEQKGGIHDNLIFEMESGGVGCVIDLVITNQTCRPIYCVKVELRTPWEDDFFEWLPATRIDVKIKEKRYSSYQAYRFPGRLGLEYPYKEVINHSLLDRGSLQPKHPCRGLLLATGGLMPAYLQHGQWQEVTLAILCADHSVYTEKIVLWTERLLSRRKPIKRRNNLPKGSEDGGALNRAPTMPGEGTVQDREFLWSLQLRTNEG